MSQKKRINMYKKGTRPQNSIEIPQQNVLKFIDLFAGIGGFHQALTSRGYRCVLASEIDKDCIQVYQDNYPIRTGNEENYIMNQDITKLETKDIPDFDILCAGFPCQSFSHAGKQQGFEDKTRGTLFYDICRILKDKQPKYFILENVKNLKNHNKGETFKTIHKTLTEELGYLTHDEPIVLSPHHLGIPQNRERVFIIGKLKEFNNNNESITRLKPYPVIVEEITKLKTENSNKCRIDTILETDSTIEKDILDYVNISDENKQVINIWNKLVKHFNSKTTEKRLPGFPIWTYVWEKKYKTNSKGELLYDKNDNDNNNKIVVDQNNNETQSRIIPKWKQNFIKKNQEFYNNKDYHKFLKKWFQESKKNKNFVGARTKFEWQAGNFQDGDDLWKLMFTFRPSGIRVKRPTYAPTLVAMAHIPYIGSRKRKLTPKECSKLQSFPDNFKIDKKITKAYKQFGNSVNVEVVKKILGYLMD